MNNILTLNNPPFTPADDQVIYLEWHHYKNVNAFIRKNYEWMKELFLSYGLNFCYLPMLGRDVIKYNAPYLTDTECDKIFETTPSLQDYVVKDEEIHGPVLAFSVENEDSDVPDTFILHYVDIETKWYKPNKSIFKQLAKDIQTSRKELEKSVVSEPTIRYGDSDIRFSLRDEADMDADDDSSTNKKRPTVRRSPIEFSIGPRRKEADEVFDEQAKVLVKEIKERINALRDCGVNTMFLHNIIDEGEHVSSLYITKDYRIILPDYDNMEITIPDLPKAVFFLFLRHLEGIRFKDLADYREELINIYRALNPIGGTQRQQHSIRELTNPLSNSINEKCARIREAFISKFDDRLAQNYYITGKRGEPKRITLDEKKVVWEQ